MKQFAILLLLNLRLELRGAGQWIGSMLFALVLLFLFALSFATIEFLDTTVVTVAESFLGVFLVLQVINARLFVHDEADDAQLLLLGSAIDPLAFYWAKLFFASLLGSVVMAPYFVFMALFTSGEPIDSYVAGLCLIDMLALSAVGVLLVQVVRRADNRALLFPILYFSLNIPVLLISIQASYSHLSGDAGQSWRWFGLLLSFLGIFLALGSVLFGEVQGLE